MLISGSVLRLLVIVPFAVCLVYVKDIARILPIELWVPLALLPPLYLYLKDMLEKKSYSLEEVEAVVAEAPSSDKPRLEIALSHGFLGWEALRHLRRFGRSSTTALQGCLASPFQKDPETVRLRLKAMAQDGLICCKGTPEDLRLVLYEMSAEGSEVLDTVDFYFPERPNTIALQLVMSRLQKMLHTQS
jgi:hypothetical protein